MKQCNNSQGSKDVAQVYKSVYALTHFLLKAASIVRKLCYTVATDTGPYKHDNNT